MNKWLAMGRACGDPETSTSTTGKTVSRFTLAVDHRFKKDGEPDADFFTCVCFGKTAEFVGQYIKKGTKILVSGEPQNNNYTDKNGNKVYGWRFIVNEVEFAESKRTESDNTDSFINIADGLTDLPFN